MHNWKEVQVERLHSQALIYPWTKTPRDQRRAYSPPHGLKDSLKAIPKQTTSSSPQTSMSLRQQYQKNEFYTRSSNTLLFLTGAAGLLAHH